MKKLFALLLGVAGFVLPAHAQHDAAAPAPAQASAPAVTRVVALARSSDAVRPARGTLYRVNHEGRTAYLFGTIHVGKPEFAFFGIEVERALAAAGKLVLELDIRDTAPLQGALQKHGLYQANENITQRIGTDTRAQLERTLERYGLQLAQVQQMKPWLVANLLIGLDLDRHGYRRQHAAEYVLLNAAAGKAVGELETAEYQMSLFDSMDPALQESYLRETLSELDDGQAQKKAAALIEAWASGDRASVEKVWQELREERSHTAEFTQRVLLEQRNPQMASKIEDLLREEKSSFVGVGMLHLLGESSVPNLLRQRGYSVERVY